MMMNTLHLRTSKAPRVAAHRVQASANQQVDRRETLGLAALLAAPVAWASSPAHAAYGDSANVFGRTTNTSGFIPYTGEGFSMLIPSKYNPSKEKDFKGVVVRYEDNGDQISHVVVLKLPTSKRSISEFGSKETFLSEMQNLGLFGKQSYTGASKSEGGFADGRYAAASLLDADAQKDKKGREYFTYDLLVRSADGHEGGRHQLVKATVGSDGQLYVLKFQVGDKRWFKGADKEALGTFESFQVV